MKMDVAKDSALFAPGLIRSFMWKCSSWRGVVNMCLIWSVTVTLNTVVILKLHCFQSDQRFRWGDYALECVGLLLLVLFGCFISC